MTTHIKRSVALADQITTKAEEAFADLAMEMTLRKWPAEFQAIMWDAVALTASERAAEVRKQ